MAYYIDVKPQAKKFLEALDPQTKKEADKAIAQLKYYPQTKGKYLGSLNSGVPFFEKRLKKAGIRIYYAVISLIVVIEEVEYEGRAPILNIGNKKTQKRDILRIK